MEPPENDLPENDEQENDPPENDALNNDPPENDPLENDPPEKSVEEVVKCGKHLSYLLARNMFLQGTPMSESTQFASSLRLNLNSSTILQTMRSGFPKLHEMMKNQQPKPPCTEFQRLLLTEMGIKDPLPRLKMEVRNMIEDEVALRSGLNSYLINTVVNRDFKQRDFLEMKVLIWDAIHPSEKAGDFLAIWSGNEELAVSIEVSEEWNKLMKEGLDSNEAKKAPPAPPAPPGLPAPPAPPGPPAPPAPPAPPGPPAPPAPPGPPGPPAPPAPPAPPEKPQYNLLKWVVEKQSDQSSAVWWFFNTELRVAVQFGSQASVLLKHFLDNLPAGQESAMKIEQLKVSLQMFAQDEGNVAAKKILELKLSGFSSAHQNITGACEADDGTVHQFKKLFIALDMIFRHPICLKKGKYKINKGEYKVRDSLNIYAKQCHGLLQELAEKLKLELKMPQEYCDSEEEELWDIIKSWTKLSPKWDLVFGKKGQ